MEKRTYKLMIIKTIKTGCHFEGSETTRNLKQMKKLLFIIFGLATFLTSCSYQGEFYYRVTNNSDYTLNVLMNGTTFYISPNETKNIIKTEFRTAWNKRINDEAYFSRGFRGVDTLNISLNNNLKICYDYLLYENWVYNYDKTRVYTYSLIIDNTDICTKD
jgi:hypothetical protein